MNILIVDDEIMVRRYLTSVASEFANVYCVENFESAREILESQEIDVIVTDIFIGPDTSFNFISQHATGIPVIAMSANPELRESSIMHGASDFIPKPIYSWEVKQILRGVGIDI